MAKLDLSGYNITPDDCNALATALADDLFFEELTLFRLFTQRGVEQSPSPWIDG